MLGGVFLLVALVRGGGMAIGWALAIAGAMYLGALVHHGHQIGAATPLVGLLLLLCGELAAWSLDERWAIRSNDLLGWRRAGALAGLALAGVASSALVIAVATVPTGHGLVWTALGAAAAVAVAGTGAWLVRR